MDNTSVGKCRYCSNQIFYSGGKTLVTCPKCGETLVVAEFINEKKKLDDALAEGKKAREALQEAERERDEAQQKLLKTLTVIEQLSDGQADSQRKLTQILENQGVNAEGQEAAISLLCNIYKGQAQDRDVLTSLFREAMRNQKTAEEKLYSLQAVAEAISKSQNNISDLLQAVSNYLDTDVINRNRQIGELVSWTQSAHKEDVVRLEAISRTTSELASGQEKIGSRISELREAVAKTELAVRDFEKDWQQSELRKLMDLYQQAENCQMDREFERAEELYQQVLAFGGRDPEVYWRLILCHYCVVYQQDEEGKQVLTILYPDLTDPKEMSARKELKNCEQSEEQRAYYEKELAKLDKVLNKYREVWLERKYDVFISVKQTVWQEGKKYYTRDRELGSILYDHLTGMGLKAFNSEEQACKCPPGQEWEPYILAALLSSKVMIVVGTCAEYMESQWVKNEWQRFQWLRKKENRKGTSERKLFCFISDSMNPYDIPKGLNPDVQAIVNGVKAFDKVDQAINGLFPNDPLPPSSPSPEITEAEMLRRLETLLILGKYEDVIREYDLQVSQARYLSSCRMHLCALCAKYKTSGIEQLTDSRVLKDTYFRLAEINAKTTRDTNDLFQIHHQIEMADPIPEPPKPNPVNPAPHEQDMDEQLKPETRKQEKNATKDISALAQEEAKLIIQLAEKNEQGRAQRKEQEQPKQEQGQKEKHKKPGGVSEPKQGQAKTRPIGKYIIAAIVIMLVVSGVVMMFKESPIQISVERQTTAESNTVKGMTFREAYKSSKFAVGNYVTFGHYPQTREGNDNTPIEWLVLAREDNKALLLSRYGLDAQPYNKEFRSITWEQCTLRAWLNGTFSNKAFTAQEQAGILLMNVDNSSSQGYTRWSTSGGNKTNDKIFLLSYAEANKYLGVTFDNESNTKSRVSPTAYAIKQESYVDRHDKNADGEAAGWWWMRSPGSNQDNAALVSHDGSLSNLYVNNDIGCVRPALWVNLESDIF